jgi:hypothetical protein
MDDKLYDILDNIVCEFSNNDLVKEYKELNEKIYKEYAHEILMFNSAKEKLEEMKKYSSNLDIYTKDLSEKKEILYSKPLMKRYLELSRLIQKELDLMSNEIAKMYSNKFKEKKVI